MFFSPEKKNNRFHFTQEKKINQFQTSENILSSWKNKIQRIKPFFTKMFSSKENNKIILNNQRNQCVKPEKVFFPRELNKIIVWPWIKFSIKKWTWFHDKEISLIKTSPGKKDNKLNSFFTHEKNQNAARSVSHRNDKILPVMKTFLNVFFVLRRKRQLNNSTQFHI